MALSTNLVQQVVRAWDIQLNGTGNGLSTVSFLGDAVLGSVSNADMATAVTAIDAALTGTITSLATSGGAGSNTVINGLTKNQTTWPTSMTGITAQEENMLVSLVLQARAGILPQQ